MNVIQNSKILFISAVYNHVITNNKWQIIGVKPLESSLSILPLQFIQDPIKPDQFSIYNPNSGSIYDANKSDCIGLERAAVWQPENVEARLIDYFEGRSNSSVNLLQIRD